MSSYAAKADEEDGFDNFWDAARHQFGSICEVCGAREYHGSNHSGGRFWCHYCSWAYRKFCRQNGELLDGQPEEITESYWLSWVIAKAARNQSKTAKNIVDGRKPDGPIKLTYTEHHGGFYEQRRRHRTNRRIRCSQSRHIKNVGRKVVKRLQYARDRQALSRIVYRLATEVDDLSSPWNKWDWTCVGTRSVEKSQQAVNRLVRIGAIKIVSGRPWINP